MKYLRDVDVDNKTVILRVDYNVPITNGTVSSFKKVDDSLETINYLIERKCRILLLSHFGRVKTEQDLKKNSLKPVYEYLKNEKSYDIVFCSTPMGPELDEAVRNLQAGQIVMAENTRFLDLKGNLESGNDIQLSLYWSRLADIFINDAFGTLHRNHASIVGIPRYIPGSVGFLVEKELKNLNFMLNSPKKPFVILMGGAKLEDKIELIYSLIEKCDFMLFGGGIANTFLKAAGYEIGASLFSPNMVEKAKSILKEFPDKVILPKDMIVSPSFNNEYFHKSIEEILIDDVIGDIGNSAIKNYKNILKKAQTIFINGTVGMYEEKVYSNGMRLILEEISELDAKTIVGGGDACSAVEKYGLSNKMDYISTGGGATLYYIAKGNLPGLDILEKNKQ